MTQSKNNDAKVGLERCVQSIVAWGVKNGRLPAFADYSGAFGTKPLDPWGRPVVFAYYSSLTKSSSGGICGRTSSGISYKGQDIAFLLISGGDDMGITSIPAVSTAFSGELTGLKSEDLFRIVTLKELQEKASCFGTTQGTLRVLNNELPNACKRLNYSAIIFGDGGVPPYVSYQFSGLPNGLANSGATIFGISTSAKGSYTIGVTVTDSVANSIKRTYVLKLMSSCN